MTKIVIYFSVIKKNNKNLNAAYITTYEKDEDTNFESTCIPDLSLHACKNLIVFRSSSYFLPCPENDKPKKSVYKSK